MATTSPLYNWQSILIYCTGFVSSTLSLLGSTGIITVARKKLGGQNRVYQRLMITLSCSDILCSLGFLVGAWTLPSEAGYPMAKGTNLTCTISGVIFISSILLTTILCCFLSVYFLVTTKYGWREPDVIRYLERPGYALACVLVTSYAAVLIATDAVAPIPAVQICTVYEPEGTENDTVNSIMIWVFTVLAASFAGTGIIATYLVYRHVYLITKASRAYDFTAANTNATQSATEQGRISISSNTTNRRREDQRQARVRRVARQAVLYILALLNTLFWPLIYNILLTYTNAEEEAHLPGWYTLIFFGFTLLPLQGFFNFLIYIKPRAKAWKKHEPELFWVQAMWLAVTASRDPPNTSSAAGPTTTQSTTTTSNFPTSSTVRSITRFVSRRLMFATTTGNRAESFAVSPLEDEIATSTRPMAATQPQQQQPETHTENPKEEGLNHPSSVPDVEMALGNLPTETTTETKNPQFIKDNPTSESLDQVKGEALQASSDVAPKERPTETKDESFEDEPTQPNVKLLAASDATVVTDAGAKVDSTNDSNQSNSKLAHIDASSSNIFSDHDNSQDTVENATT